MLSILILAKTLCALQSGWIRKLVKWFRTEN